MQTNYTIKPEDNKEAEKKYRVHDMLLSSFGNKIRGFLDDDDVIEIMLNPDGYLWVERFSNGRTNTMDKISTQNAERIIRIVSSQTGSICNENHPLLSAELPGSGSRFQGVLPPIVANPTFTIRKKAIMIFTLDDYVKQDIMSTLYADIIKEAVRERKNILIVGGTGSGKTTLTNAILDEIAKYQDRIVLIEDTHELQCNAKDCVFLRSKDGVANTTDLLKATMRLRPDRIIVGEVRGGEALDLLKAWNTGHPGGVSTIHANGTEQGLIRLEQLIQEAVSGVPRTLIAEAVDMAIFIKRHGASRKVKDIISVEGCDLNNQYILNHLGEKNVQEIKTA